MPRLALQESQSPRHARLVSVVLAAALRLSLHDGEGIRLVTHPGHRADDAARPKVDHVQVTELLRERRQRGAAADHGVAAVGRDRRALRASGLSVGPDEGDAGDFRAMESRALPFAPLDVLLLQGAGAGRPGSASALATAN